VQKSAEGLESEVPMAFAMQLVGVEVSCQLAVEALSAMLMRQGVDRSSTESCEDSRLKEQTLRY
jgi:hypothetical protein